MRQYCFKILGHKTDSRNSGLWWIKAKNFEEAEKALKIYGKQGFVVDVKGSDVWDNLQELIKEGKVIAKWDEKLKDFVFSEAKGEKVEEALG